MEVFISHFLCFCFSAGLWQRPSPLSRECRGAGGALGVQRWRRAAGQIPLLPGRHPQWAGMLCRRNRLPLPGGAPDTAVPLRGCWTVSLRQQLPLSPWGLVWDLQASGAPPTWPRAETSTWKGEGVHLTCCSPLIGCCFFTETDGGVLLNEIYTGWATWETHRAWNAFIWWD